LFPHEIHISREAILDKITSIESIMEPLKPQDLTTRTADDTTLADPYVEEVGEISHTTWNSPINSEADLAKAIDERFRYRGWGRCLGIEKHSGRKTVYSIRIGHSPLTQDRQAREPTCRFLRGILAAWLEKYVGSKPENAVEATCGSVRLSECIFEFTFSGTSGV